MKTITIPITIRTIPAFFIFLELSIQGNLLVCELVYKSELCKQYFKEHKNASKKLEKNT